MVAYVLFQILQIYFYLMIAAIVLTWTPLVKTRLYKFLEMITDPYLRIFRGYIIVNHFDLTPILGLVLYQGLLMLLSTFL